LLRDATLDKAVDAPIINNHLKEDRVKCAELVAGIVAEVLQPFKEKNKMSLGDIALWTEDFLELYYTDSFEDLAMMFKLARQGQLSQDYHLIDGVKLFGWYKEWLELKWNEKEHRITEAKAEKPTESIESIHRHYEKLKQAKSDKRPDHINTLEAKIDQGRKYRKMFTNEQLQDLADQCRRFDYIADAVFFETQKNGS